MQHLGKGVIVRVNKNTGTLLKIREQNEGAYITTSQLDGNEDINFETSTSTSTTTLSLAVIKECLKHVHKNPEEIKKRRAREEYMRQSAKKKATKHPKAENPNAKKGKK